MKRGLNAGDDEYRRYYKGKEIIIYLVLKYEDYVKER